MVSTSFLVASVAVTKLRCPRTELCIEPSQIIEQSQILFFSTWAQYRLRNENQFSAM